MDITTNDEDQLTLGGDQLRFRACSDELLAIEVTMQPGGGPPALHRHDPFELYRVEQGEFTFYIADDTGEVQRTTSRTGDVVAVPGGREHTIRNESDAESRAFVVFTPGAPMERFFRAAAAAPRDMDAVLAIAAAHGVELTRPLP